MRPPCCIQTMAHKGYSVRAVCHEVLMRRLDLAAHEKGLLHQEMSDLHCRKAFDIVASSLGVPTFTPKGRRRHLERTKWPTYLRIMPNKVRVGAKPYFFSTNQISDKQCL